MLLHFQVKIITMTSLLLDNPLIAGSAGLSLYLTRQHKDDDESFTQVF